jgi:CPA2 family monovalent cation:H+ antiporter-2
MTAIYGDASRRDILEAAGIQHARFLLVTLPDLPGRVAVVATARLLNPGIRILSRARYLGERVLLEEAGADWIAYEEAEVAVTLASFLLNELGLQEDTIEQETARVRSEITGRGETASL